MADFNLNNCDVACFGCIKKYKKKHDLKEGETFRIACHGIPKTFLPILLAESIPEAERKTALSMLDPVTWAAETLDWHCIDPDGSIWKRKNPDEYERWVRNNPGKPVISRYHRPYQAEMLRCTSKRKVFRCGRQIGKSECIVVAMLFHLFTKPGVSENEGFKILVLTPYQSQIDIIFGRCMELIRANPILQNSIKRHVKAPQYTIELHNGSILRGFTAGTKSGNNAGAARGQHANMLVFDEADYLSAGDIDSALSVITNFPDASVWMSSTPTGKRERFYETCQSKIWKEFFYPSRINPMWTEELDQLFKETLTHLGYRHEVDADFGEQEEGVFQNVYVAAAKMAYKYGSLPYSKDWIYTIGVDWNDVKIGTTIAVTGFNAGTNTFYLVDRHVVKREGWTQLDACQKISELNAVWLPAAIYVDKGFGGTQFEVLRKFSFDAVRDPTKGPGHPDSRLKDVLKQYDFGSKIEIHDLITKAPIQKAAKPFLVENMVRRFETQNFKFPESDDQLEKELQGYIIDRVTQSGTPVYKPGNETVGDHTLDAVMLAQVAFTLEKTGFGTPLYRADVAFSGPIGFNKPADPDEPSFIIKNDKPDTEKADRRPPLNRTENIGGKESILGGGLPAAHVGGQLQTWTWEGFGKDEARPTSGNLINPIGRGRRPTRKNI